MINGDKCIYKGISDNKHIFYNQRLNQLVLISESELMDFMRSNQIIQRSTT